MAKKSTKVDKLALEIAAFVRDVTKVGSMPKSRVQTQLRTFMEAGYKAGWTGAARAYGGCTNCYGKGYSTTLTFAEGGKNRWQLPVMHPCKCARGKELKRIWDETAGQSNSLLRSAYQVAKRKGKATNWEVLTKALDKELKRQHKYLMF